MSKHEQTAFKLHEDTGLYYSENPPRIFTGRIKIKRKGIPYDMWMQAYARRRDVGESFARLWGSRTTSTVHVSKDTLKMSEVAFVDYFDGEDIYTAPGRNAFYARSIKAWEAIFGRGYLENARGGTELSITSTAMGKRKREDSPGHGVASTSERSSSPGRKNLKPLCLDDTEQKPKTPRQPTTLKASSSRSLVPQCVQRDLDEALLKAWGESHGRLEDRTSEICEALSRNCGCDFQFEESFVETISQHMWFGKQPNFTRTIPWMRWRRKNPPVEEPVKNSKSGEGEEGEEESCRHLPTLMRKAKKKCWEYYKRSGILNMMPCELDPAVQREVSRRRRDYWKHGIFLPDFYPFTAQEKEDMAKTRGRN
ncbi:hypothetical protein HDK77DRAFT_428321 [Phyllosticta capitalensis]